MIQISYIYEKKRTQVSFKSFVLPLSTEHTHSLDLSRGSGLHLLPTVYIPLMP